MFSFQYKAQTSKTNKRTLSFDEAREEFVGDSLETMFASMKNGTESRAIEKLADIQKTDKTRWQKIVGVLRDILKRIKAFVTGINKEYSKLEPDSAEGKFIGQQKDAVEKLRDLFVDVLSVAAENQQWIGSDVQTKNTTEDGGVKYSERDYPIDASIEKTVNAAFVKSGSNMNELSSITPEQNRAINRLVNQTKDNSYRGKFEGGKHKFSDTAIRHIMAEHGDFLREGLRAQLPMRKEDIARHLSAIKNNKAPSSIKPTRTARGNPSILTSYEVNGYTLYAEEITKSLGQNLPSDLIGHTMYKAPTLATAAAPATSAGALPRRQNQVLCNYSIPNSTDLSTGNFIADENGAPALLSLASKNGSPNVDTLHGGLIALSSDAENLTSKSGVVLQGYVLCENPYYITQDHRVFDNSKTNVAEKINELKKQGYDCFIFDKVTGDNYMVAVVNKAQIVMSTPTVVNEHKLSDRDVAEKDSRYSDRNSVNISDEEYDRFVRKGPIKASKVDKAKVAQERKRLYSKLENEEDIPDIDIFSLAEYNEVNKGYVYVVHNFDRENFWIIKKARIKPDVKSVIKERSDLNNDRQANDTVNRQTLTAENGRELHRSSLLDDRNEGAIQQDVGGRESNGQSDQTGRVDKSSLDNRTGVKYQNRTVYTEEQYNAFGWASYNGVLTPYERETLLSRYADFKHNKDKYPVTSWGEAVIHSTETPDVIIYVRASSSIEVPEITRIVRIEDDISQNVSKIRERIIKNEERQILSPYQTVTAYYGEEVLRFDRRRDYASFQEYLSREERRNSETAVSDRGEQQDGGRGVQKSERDLQSDGELKYQDRDYAEIERQRRVNKVLETEDKHLQSDVHIPMHKSCFSGGVMHIYAGFFVISYKNFRNACIWAAGRV